MTLPIDATARRNRLRESGVSRNVKRFRAGLVFKAHRRLYHSTLGSRVIKRKKKKSGAGFRKSGRLRAPLLCHQVQDAKLAVFSCHVQPL